VPVTEANSAPIDRRDPWSTPGDAVLAPSDPRVRRRRRLRWWFVDHPGWAPGRRGERRRRPPARRSPERELHLPGRRASGHRAADRSARRGHRRDRRPGGVRPPLHPHHHRAAPRRPTDQPAGRGRGAGRADRAHRPPPVRRAVRPGAGRGRRGLGGRDLRRRLRRRRAGAVPARRLLRDRPAVALRVDPRRVVRGRSRPGRRRPGARAQLARVQAERAAPRRRRADRAGHGHRRQLPGVVGSRGVGAGRGRAPTAPRGRRSRRVWRSRVRRAARHRRA
jgi:hypothetical protein